MCGGETRETTLLTARGKEHVLYLLFEAKWVLARASKYGGSGKSASDNPTPIWKWPLDERKGGV